jgi:hypothetical protein
MLGPSWPQAAPGSQRLFLAERKMTIESALNYVSSSLGISAESLMKLINFESSFNPSATNSKTKARGLIQFMPDTAREMGFKDADELVTKYPDVESQLRGPVLSYLSQYKPFSNPQSLYLSVFYPAFRYSPLDTAFPSKVQSQNPGINYIGDYVSKVDKKKLNVVFTDKYSFFSFFLPISTAILLVTYLNIRRRSNERGSIEKF